MKIKLKRALWNHQEGEEMDVQSARGQWAIDKGLAEAVFEPENKMIQPIYRNRIEIEKKAGRPKKLK